MRRGFGRTNPPGMPGPPVGAPAATEADRLRNAIRELLDDGSEILWALVDALSKHAARENHMGEGYCICGGWATSPFPGQTYDRHLAEAVGAVFDDTLRALLNEELEPSDVKAPVAEAPTTVASRGSGEEAK